MPSPKGSREQVPEGLKICTGCNEAKPLAEFYRDKRGRGGHVAECKACKRARCRKWKEDNPERHAEHQRAYRKRHPEPFRQGHKRERERHPEKAFARKEVTKAVQRGDLVKPPAEPNPDCPFHGSSPQAEVQDCKACEGTGFLEAVRFGPTGAFERDRPCYYCGATGKQPPAEPQEKFGGGAIGKPTGTRCDSCGKEERVGDEGWESREDLSWCPDCFTEDEPQGDVVEKDAVLQRLEALAKDFEAARQRDGNPAWAAAAAAVRITGDEEILPLPDLTPLLALEVKERLEGFLDSPAFLEHLQAGGKRRRDVLDAFFGAFTPAPSEPEEGSK